MFRPACLWWLKTFLGSLLVALPVLQSRGEELQVRYADLAVLLRGKQPTVGLIYPQDGTLSTKANFPGVSNLQDLSGMPHDVLHTKLLAPVNAMLVQMRDSGVLTIGNEASELTQVRTTPIKAGKYSGFDLLEKALAGHPQFRLTRVGMGGQRMGGMIELKTDLPSMSLLELMFFVTKEQGGNFWSISPSEMKLPTPEGAKKPLVLLPFVLLVTPPN